MAVTVVVRDDQLMNDFTSTQPSTPSSPPLPTSSQAAAVIHRREAARVLPGRTRRQIWQALAAVVALLVGSAMAMALSVIIGLCGTLGVQCTDSENRQITLLFYLALTLLAATVPTAWVLLRRRAPK